MMTIVRNSEVSVSRQLPKAVLEMARCRECGREAETSIQSMEKTDDGRTVYVPICRGCLQERREDECPFLVR